MEPIDDAPEASGNEIEAPAAAGEMLETKNFFELVNDDAGDNLEVEYEEDGLMDDTDEHIMSPMLDMHQHLGVTAAKPANYCA